MTAPSMTAGIPIASAPAATLSLGPVVGSLLIDGETVCVAVCDGCAEVSPGDGVGGA